MSEFACNEVVETITAYLDGTISRLGTLEETALSPRAGERLIAAFREWRS